MNIQYKTVQGIFLSLLLISTSYISLAQASFPENDPTREARASRSPCFFLKDDSVSEEEDSRTSQRQDLRNLWNLTSNQGAIFRGAPEEASSFSYFYISGTGDVNDDGIADVIVGSPYSSPQGRYRAGEAYVVYGKKGGYPNPLDLSYLNASQGFVIQGAQLGDITGASVGKAGDINDDGIADIIIGAPADNSLIRSVVGLNMTATGKAYVIYGKKEGYAVPVDLSSLTPNEGFLIKGARSRGNAGHSVSGAGDVNNDGIADVIIGAPNTSPYNRLDAGKAYVIYGKKGGYAAPLDLSSLTSSEGFLIRGAQRRDNTGSSVSGAGDVNGDGIADVIIGAWNASPQKRLFVGGSLCDLWQTRGL